MYRKSLVAFAIFVLAGLAVVPFVSATCCPPCAPGFTPGFWKHNIGVYLDIANGAPSAFEGGPLDGVKCDASILGSTLLTNALAGLSPPHTLEDIYGFLSTGGGGDIAQARADWANWLNSVFGYGNFV